MSRFLWAVAFAVLPGSLVAFVICKSVQWQRDCQVEVKCNLEARERFASLSRDECMAEVFGPDWHALEATSADQVDEAIFQSGGRLM